MTGRPFLLVLLLLLGCAFANDVGPDYDSSNVDVQSWEKSYGSFPFRSYRSSNLTSPAVRKAVDSSECYDDNYLFLAPRGFRVPNPAVTILDNHGNLIWSRFVQGQAYNLKVQEYKGEKVLTYWVGDDAVGGHGEGYFYLLNSAYEEVARIRGVNNLRADLHELTITPQGTALVTYYQIFPLQQPGVFRIKDTVFIWDCLFQEFDIAKQELIFEWRASEHHHLNESYAPMGNNGYTMEHPYDWYHINSVEKDELGNYLVSARFTSSVTYIDGKTGDVIWVLGGKRNSFSDLSNGLATDMAYQHLARFHPLTAFPGLLAKDISDHGTKKHKDGMTKQLLTAFDNGLEQRPARGVLIELTYPSQSISSNAPLTAKLLKSYDHPLRIPSVSQGSLQLVSSNVTGKSDPHVLVAYGHVGVWTEFTADGKILCDSRIATQKSWGQGHVQSYSVLKDKWVGKPSYLPSAVACASRSAVFVSWNGATEVKAWKLQYVLGDGSDSTDNTSNAAWKDVITVEKAGFETALPIPQSLHAEQIRLYRVLALDMDGKVLATSSVVNLQKQVFMSRITEMVPLHGSIVWIVGLLAVIALVISFKDRIDRWRLGGYQKLRKH